MNHFRFFLLPSLVAAGTWMQPAISRDMAATPAPAPEQRRAELRLALKAPHGQTAPNPAQTLDNSPANRHLSAQERANLRQQLRQQRREAQPERP